MNEFYKRILSGIIYVIILVTSILYSKITFLSVFFIIMMFCLYEFMKIIQLKSVYPYIFGFLSFLFGNVLSVEDVPSRAIYQYAGLVLFLSVFSSFVWILFAKKEEIINHLGKIFLTVIYIVIPFVLMAQIPFLEHGFNYANTVILGVFLLIWSNDTFAYLVGKNFGKIKLLKHISPNKTVEGFIGGMVASFIAGYIIAQFFTELSTVQWIVIAGLVSIFGVLGDLIESMFKRQAGIKDSSNLIPGHGGFLDRFDSVIFAAPFIFIYLYFI